MKWKDRIKEAKQLDGFSSHDKKAANDWVCCAVGEVLDLKNDSEFSNWLCENHPKLSKLGVKFDHAVYGNEVELAKSVYDDIRKYCRENEIDVPERFKMARYI